MASFSISSPRSRQNHRRAGDGRPWHIERRRTDGRPETRWRWENWRPGDRPVDRSENWNVNGQTRTKKTFAEIKLSVSRSVGQLAIDFASAAFAEMASRTVPLLSGCWPYLMRSTARQSAIVGHPIQLHDQRRYHRYTRRLHGQERETSRSVAN